MQQQLPQVAHFTRRHPDPRKPPFHQQLQNMRRIALIRPLCQGWDSTVASRSGFCLISLVSPRHGSPRLWNENLRNEAHAQGTLHSGRDRPGTVRANLVGDLCFRVCSYVILKRLPIAPLILYLLARQTDWQEPLQGTNVRQGRLEFSKRALFFVLCPVTRCQRFSQFLEVTAKVKF